MLRILNVLVKVINAVIDIEDNWDIEIIPGLNNSIYYFTNTFNIRSIYMVSYCNGHCDLIPEHVLLFSDGKSSPSLNILVCMEIYFFF